MLTPIGVGFYSYNGRKVFGDTAGDVDEVIESTFFIVFSRTVFGLNRQ